MSVDKCTPELLANGQIDKDQAERMDATYRDLLSDLAPQMGEEAAKAKASEETVKRLAAEAAQAKRQAVLQIAAQQRIGLEATKFKGPKEKAFAAFIAHDDRAPYDNAEYRVKVVEGQAHALMEGILAKHSRNMAGQVRNRALLRNVVREAFGEHTGDASAKELADAWGQTAEMLRTRFNAAGGAVGKLEKWGLPQTHNMERVRSVPYEEWRDFIAPLLDRQQMLDQATGLPMSPQALELALKQSYERIRSDGWIDQSPGTFKGGGKMGNRHADSRFLAFKDADAWMEYNKRFGRPLSKMGESLDPDGVILDAMTGHVASMSRDIALMEILGPNPTATVRWMTDSMKREENVSTDRTMRGIQKAMKGAHWVETLYNELAGRNPQPIYGKLARWFSAFRSLQVAAKLGSATLSATTDMGFQQVTRRFNGLPAAKQVASYAKMLNPASSADRALALRSGLVATEAAKRAVAQSRWVGDAVNGETAARLAEMTMRASGLSAWTQAGQWAFGMDFLSHITHTRNQAFGSLNAAFRRTLERYGIGEPQWDAIRSTPLEEHEGSQWIRPQNMPKELADKVMGMILAETDYAVPNVTLATRALFGQLPKGTLFAEILRSPLQFKTFSASVMMTHGHRMMEQQGFNRLKYGAGLAITTGLLGGLVLQMQAIARGQDPVPMGEHGMDPTFWGQALFQGGGIGIFGDFLKSATDRYDNQLLATAAGPMWSDVVGGVRVGKQAFKAAKGEDNKLASATIKQLKADLPGSSLWYTKLAFQRTMLDQMQRQIDPNYDEAFQRMRTMGQQNGTEYYWQPGELSPDRAPDLTNAAKPAPTAN